MVKYLPAVLAVVLISSCNKANPPEPSEGLRDTGMTAYTLVRDVKTGEKLDMAMLKPATIATKTVEDEVIKDLMLTSADIESFLGRSFKQDASKGDFLEKELFE